jgi:outer membrane protein assembly factor BamE (lipoprotein component of BamABCDE complex)
MRIAVILLISILMISCSPSYHQEQLHSTKERDMTVGIVQKEIRVGMSPADVAEALGSPNIVTKDKEGSETWIYDKIATEASYSKGAVGGAAGAGGVAGSALVLGLISGSHESGAYGSTQKTLTVIIKYDDSGLVKNFSYHSSKF